MGKEYKFINLYLTFLLITLSVWGASIWCAGSLITSGIKSVSNDCGKEYKADIIFDGNWFCPSKR